MYKLMIAASSFEQLRLKLLEAAHSIVTPQTTPVDKFQEPEFNDPNFEIEEEDEFAEEVQSAPQVAVPVAANATHDLDTRGVAWTPKIHSPTKSRNKDGSWRLRRNTDPKLVAKLDKPLQVLPSQETTTENQASAPQQVAPPQVPHFINNVPVTSTHHPVPEFVVVPPPPPSPQLAVVPPAPVEAPKTYTSIPVPAGTRPAHSFDSFRLNLVPTLSLLVETGIVNPEYLDQLKQYFGVKEIWDLSKNEVHVREMFENFCANGLITRMD